MTAADVLQIVAMAALWGGSFLFLRIAVPELGPVPLIFVRVVLATLALLPFVLARQEWRRQFRAHWATLAVLGVLNAAVPFPLFAFATLHVTAGFAAILNATAPLFAAVVARLWLKDRMPLPGMLGVALGMGGVAVLVGGLDQRMGGPGLAVAGALLGSLLYGVSASFVKRRLACVNSWVTTTGSFGMAAVVLLPLAWLQWPEKAPSGRAWIAVILLAIVCTAIPNIFYFRLVLRVGPGRAMTVAFLIPVFGLLWGAMALGEQVTGTMLAGAAVILVGTALVTGLLRPPRRLYRSRTARNAPASGGPRKADHPGPGPGGPH